VKVGGCEEQAHDDCGAVMFTMAERAIALRTKPAGSVGCMFHVAFDLSKVVYGLFFYQ
jgi:hypothetical protein